MIGVPAQVPGAALNVAPTMARPVTLGGVPPSDGARGLTAVVDPETATAFPSPLLATSRTLRVRPTSVAVVVYVPPVSPGRSWQPLPVSSQHCHWRAHHLVPCLDAPYPSDHPPRRGR